MQYLLVGLASWITVSFANPSTPIMSPMRRSEGELRSYDSYDPVHMTRDARFKQQNRPLINKSPSHIDKWDQVYRSSDKKNIASPVKLGLKRYVRDADKFFDLPKNIPNKMEQFMNMTPKSFNVEFKTRSERSVPVSDMANSTESTHQEVNSSKQNNTNTMDNKRESKSGGTVVSRRMMSDTINKTNNTNDSSQNEREGEYFIRHRVVEQEDTRNEEDKFPRVERARLGEPTFPPGSNERSRWNAGTNNEQRNTHVQTRIGDNRRHARGVMERNHRNQNEEQQDERRGRERNGRREESGRGGPIIPQNRNTNQ